jgi:hypothetical protein
MAQDSARDAGTAFCLRLDGELTKQLDEWRRRQPEILSKSASARELIARALSSEYCLNARRSIALSYTGPRPEHHLFAAVVSFDMALRRCDAGVIDTGAPMVLVAQQYLNGPHSARKLVERSNRWQAEDLIDRWL